MTHHSQTNIEDLLNSLCLLVFLAATISTMAAA
jgi:hypothetical protein